MSVSQKEMELNMVKGGNAMLNKNNGGRDIQLKESKTSSKQPKHLTKKDIESKLANIMRQKGMIK